MGNIAGPNTSAGPVRKVVVSSGYRSSSRKSKEHKIAIEPYLYICMHVSVAVHSTMRPLNTATNQVDELPASIVEDNYKHG